MGPQAEIGARQASAGAKTRRQSFTNASQLNSDAHRSMRGCGVGVGGRQVLKDRDVDKHNKGQKIKQAQHRPCYCDLVKTEAT